MGPSSNQGERPGSQSAPQEACNQKARRSRSGTGAPLERPPAAVSEILRATAVLELAGAWELARFGGMDVEQAETGLIALAAQGLLERFWFPGEGEQPGRWLVCLTRRGALKAKVLVGRKVRCLRIDHKASVFVHHQLAVSQAVASVVAGLGRESIHTLIVGNQLSAGLKAAGARSKYAPDAYLAFRVGSGAAEYTRHLFLEVDCGTEGRHQLRAKLRRLDRYYLDEHRRILGSDRLMVAFTVPTDQREEVVTQVIREGHCRVRVVVARQSEAVDGDPVTPGWRDGRTGEVCSLADPC
jgi:hypothetical protein